MQPKRYLAMVAGEVHYVGNPCKHGHESLRYTTNGACVTCVKARAQSDQRAGQGTIGSKIWTKYRVGGAKDRAKKSGVPFDAEAVRTLCGQVPTHCPILGLELTHSAGGSPSDTSPSLDRIVPELGYVAGNLQWVSNLANMIMTHATPAQVLTTGKYMIAQQRARYLEGDE